MLYNVFFSAKGTTKFCAEFIGSRLAMECVSHDWFSQPCNNPMELSKEDILLFSMPVYGGFIPAPCLHMTQNLKGNNTPAIITAIYGNRHYDDALLQMKDILTEHGFLVIAAGAFLAEHSIFTTVATGRPDEKDKAAMEKFAEKCSELLNEKDISKLKAVTVPGTPGYDISSFKGFPIKPDGDETCIGCGKCAKICPQKAINADEPRKTNVSRCIACGACIKNCPVGARDYHNEAFGGIRTNFESMCALYRTPEMFFAE